MCENIPWIEETFEQFCYSVMTGRKRVLDKDIWHIMKVKALETPPGSSQTDMWQLGASAEVRLFSPGGFL